MKIPSLLFQGLHSITETTLAGLDPFYASMIWSYALVNDLFYKKNKHLDLPINLWGHPLSKHINKVFANSGFMTVTDLPYLHKKINF